MASNSINDQARVAIASVGQAGRGALHYALRSPVSRWLSGPPSAHHLLIVPQDLRTADPSFATELYDGYFGLAGAVVATGSESPFAIRPPTPAWQRELYAFSWLRNLHAAGDEIAQEKARALLRNWVALGRSAPLVAWEKDIAARRVIALLSHAGFLLDGVEAGFYDAFMRALTAELHSLSVSQSGRDYSVPQLRASAALVFAALCIAEQQTYLNVYLDSFQAELERQILPDGGHISRNPACVLDLLMDFLPLKQCFIARKMEPPDFLYKALERMPAMLRMLRLGDGSIARMNGMGATPLDFLSAALVYDDGPLKPAIHAVNSGYCRLARGATVIIADLGPPPPVMCSARAHAGCLSFEMSSGAQAVIVNCGAPKDEDGDWSVVCRSTAAHSTLTLNDASSSRLLNAKNAAKRDAYLLSGPKAVRAEVTEDENSASFRGAHDGFRDRFQVLHKRRLRLSPDGDFIECSEQLAAAPNRTAFAGGAAAFAIRIHLHPAIAAIRTNDPFMVALGLPGGEIWRLKAEGARVDIEESIFLAGHGGPRRSLQIVLSGSCASEAQIVWTMAKDGPQARRPLRQPEAAAPAPAAALADEPPAPPDGAS